MLRLNCKILFHTAVRGNIKATRDFLYLKGSTSVYSVLFLNLVGQMPLPSQASQSQHSIQVKLCPFGPGAPSPSPTPWVPASAEAHRSINLGIWGTPRGRPAADAAGRGRTPPAEAAVLLPPPWPRAQDELRCFAGETGISCLLQSLPILFYWFLVVSALGGGEAEKKRGGGEIKRPTRFWLSFAASTWCKSKLVGEDP